MATSDEVVAIQSGQPLQPINVSELGDSLTVKPEISYNRLQSVAPIESPANNLFAALFFRDTTIGSIVRSPNQGSFDPALNSETSFLRFVPDRYIGRFDAYAKVTNPNEARDITNSLDQEYQDQATIAASPYQSFFYSLGAQALDPINWIPGTVIFNNAKRLSTVAKATLNAGVTGLGSTIAQEAIIQQNQFTREVDESIYNVLAAGTLSAVLGGAAQAYGPQLKRYGSKAKDFARQELLDMYVDTAKKLTPEGTLDANSIAKLPAWMQKGMKFSLMNRMLTSEDFDTPKNVAAIMFDHNYTLQKNLDGVANKSAELNIKVDLAKTVKTLIDYDDIFFKHAGVKRGFGAFRAAEKRAAQDGTGLILNKTAFDREVGFRMFSDIEHSNPAVNEAAALFNRDLIEPTLKKLVEQGHLPEGVTPKNAKKYFTVIWNRQKIKENEAGFMSMVTTWYNKVSNVVRDVRDTNEYKTLDAELKTLKQELKAAKAKGNKTEATSVKERIAKQTDLLNKFSRKAASLYLEPDELEAIFHTKGKRNGQLRQALTETEIAANVRQTTDRVAGNDTSKIKDQILNQLDQKPRPMHDRSFLIPQRVAFEWQLQSAPDVMASYIQSVTPVIRLTELAKQNGFDSIDAWYKGLTEQLKKEFDLRKQDLNGKQAANLDTAFNRQKENIKNSFELLLGIYGDGPNIHDNSAAKFYRTLMDWNYIRLLGFMTLSAIPELGLHVMTHGPFAFMYDGIRPVLKQSIGLLQSFSKDDLNAIGYALQTVKGTRLKSMAHHAGLTTQPSFFGKTFDSMVNTFGNVSLMNQWNDIQQNIAGTMGINRTLKSIEQFVTTGKMNSKERLRLAKIGLEEKNFQIIYDMWQKYGGQDGGTYFANWTKWDVDSNIKAEALLNFQRSVAHEIDNTILTPGLGDKPLFTQSSLGKLLTQFKSYQFSATNRIFFSGLQRLDDVNLYYGIVSMLSLGALSYTVSQVVRGNKDIDLSFANLSREAIDRSALLGIFSEAYNIAEKAGFGGGTSRFQSRGVWGALLGPSIGSVEDILTVFNRVRTADNQNPLTTKDLEKILRLSPYQNLFYIYTMNRKVLGEVGTQLGVEDPSETRHKELFK